MPIVPDTKNWTWVLERRCPDCGFDASSVAFRDIPALTRQNARDWMPVLERADVRDRPDDATWSALEYAAHTRDVFRIFTRRLRLMLDVPVDWRYLSADEWHDGIKSVRLVRASGDILLERSSPAIACLSQPGQPQHDLVLPRRTLRECLAEELRRLDPDLLYGRVITEGWQLLGPPASTEANG